MSFIKDNGGIIAVAGVVVIILGAVADWRVGEKVQDALADKGFATNDKITKIEADLAEQKEIHKDDRDRMDGKIERIVDILLED